MRRVARGAAAIAALLLVVHRNARAHIMPEGHGSTRIVGARAYTLLAVPASALRAFDDDGDALISRAELQAHGPAMEAMLQHRFQLFAGTIPGRVLYQTLAVEHSDDPTAPTASITLVRISEWDVPLASLRVVTDLAKSNAVEFRVIRGDSTETRMLAAGVSGVDFFSRAPRAIAASKMPGLSRVRAADLALAFAAVVVIASGWLLARRPLARG